MEKGHFGNDGAQRRGCIKNYSKVMNLREGDSGTVKGEAGIVLMRGLGPDLSQFSLTIEFEVVGQGGRSWRDDGFIRDVKIIIGVSVEVETDDG